MFVWLTFNWDVENKFFFFGANWAVACIIVVVVVTIIIDFKGVNVDWVCLYRFVERIFVVVVVDCNGYIVVCSSFLFLGDTFFFNNS